MKKNYGCSDYNLWRRFCWATAVRSFATAIVFENLPSLEIVADIRSVADVLLPVAAVLAKRVSDVVAGVPRLDSVRAMNNWWRWSWLEWVVTGATTAVTTAWNLVRLVQLLQFTVPVTASMAFLLRKDTIEREKTNACQFFSELALDSFLKAKDLICIKLGAPLLRQERHSAALVLLIVVKGHVLRARLVVSVVVIWGWRFVCFDG